MEESDISFQETQGGGSRAKHSLDTLLQSRGEKVSELITALTRESVTYNMYAAVLEESKTLCHMTL